MCSAACVLPYFSQLENNVLHSWTNISWLSELLSWADLTSAPSGRPRYRTLLLAMWQSNVSSGCAAILKPSCSRCGCRRRDMQVRLGQLAGGARVTVALDWLTLLSAQQGRVIPAGGGLGTSHLCSQSRTSESRSSEKYWSPGVPVWTESQHSWS